MIKRTNKLALALGALLAVALADSAQAAAMPAGMTATVTPSIVSNYMFRGQRLGGLSAQLTAEVASGPLTAGIWANNPVEQEVVGVSDPEIDPYVTFTHQINDSLNVVPGLMVYLYPKADETLGFYKLTTELSLAANWTSGGFKVTPKLYYDIKLKQWTIEGTAMYAMPLEAWGTSLNLMAQAGSYLADDAVNGVTDAKAWGNYYQLGATAPYKVSDTSTLTLGVAYAWGDDSYTKVASLPKVKNGLEDDRWVFSLSYSISL